MADAREPLGMTREEAGRILSDSNELLALQHGIRHAQGRAMVTLALVAATFLALLLPGSAGVFVPAALLGLLAYRAAEDWRAAGTPYRELLAWRNRMLSEMDDTGLQK